MGSAKVTKTGHVLQSMPTGEDVPPRPKPIIRWAKTKPKAPKAPEVVEQVEVVEVVEQVEQTQPQRFASPEEVPEPLPDLSHLLPGHRVVIEEILTKYPHMIEKVREAAR